jgi:hypothetical protein
MKKGDAPDSRKQKKAYAPPALRRLGTLSALTQAFSGTSLADGVGGRMRLKRVKDFFRLPG